MGKLARSVLLCALLVSGSGCLRLYHEAVHHQRVCKTSAEFMPWDQVVFFLTLGAPLLLIESLTLVPLVVDFHLAVEHDRLHHLGHYRPKSAKRP